MNFQLCVDKKKGGKNSKGLKEASFYLELGNKKFAFANLKLNQKKGSLNFEFDEDKSGGRKKRFPYFPRLGVVAEVGGKTYSFKQGSILETLYKKDMSTEEGATLALKAINAALKRDSASGNGIDIMIVTKNGIKHVVKEVLTYDVKLSK